MATEHFVTTRITNTCIQADFGKTAAQEIYNTFEDLNGIDVLAKLSLLGAGVIELTQQYFTPSDLATLRKGRYIHYPMNDVEPHVTIKGDIAYNMIAVDHYDGQDISASLR